MDQKDSDVMTFPEETMNDRLNTTIKINPNKDINARL